MKRITETRAKELIKAGNFPKCKVSRGVYHTVTSLNNLEDLKRLSSVQLFELYEDDYLENLPDDAMVVSIDESIQLLADKETVNCLRNGQLHTISSVSQLMDIIRSCRLRGDNFELFWLVA